MNTVHTISELKEIISAWRTQGLKIGFVPTMGGLHKGHLSLVETARKHCDKVVASIYVNPLQFSPEEDFDTYPRDLKSDSKKLDSVKTDLIFAPSTEELYPDGVPIKSKVEVPELAKRLCGISRPHFFGGVCTAVAKLFNIVQADVAVFGEKDYQQLLNIRRMVKDLNFPIEVIGSPTVREANQLAMSSRNAYLTDEERRQSATLYQTMEAVAEKIRHGSKNYSQLIQDAIESLHESGFIPDYFEICNNDDLKPATENDTNIRIFVAAYLGKARLIDNIRI